MRLIDADEFKEYIKNGFEAMQHLFKTDEYRERMSKITTGFLQDIDEQPTVDAVEVVRCRDCKWNKERECPLSYTSPISVDGEVSIWYKNNDNDYCSYGERKGGAE